LAGGYGSSPAWTAAAGLQCSYPRSISPGCRTRVRLACQRVGRFYAHAIDQHQETERYLFLAVVRAAREHLHLSYAQADDRDVYRPSPYLELAAAVLGQPVAVPSPPALTPGTAPPAAATPPLQARRPGYTIAEIAHFGLCPFRYKLETLDAGARTYRDATDAFQLGPLAQALWLNLACARLAASGEEVTGAAAVRDMLFRALEAAKAEAQTAFAGLRDLEWFTVERYARRDFASAAKPLDGYPVRVVAATPTSYVIPDGDRTMQVEVPVRHAFRKGVFRYPFFSDLLREEWLLPGSVPEDGQAAFAQADGVRVFASLYHAVQWWHQASTTAFFYAATRNQRNKFAEEKQQDYARVQQEIRDWLPLIEAGHYPKNPGDHCHYCPVRGECLGL
jgi:hypothetical protein